MLAAFEELPVGSRLLGQMVLVGLRDLPPVRQNPAENLGHRPRRRWRQRRQRGSRLPAKLAVHDRGQPGRRRHDLHGQLGAAALRGHFQPR